MKKESAALVQILSILNQFDTIKQIELVERLGKRLRQANSVQTAKEVHQFAVKRGVKKEIDKYPINGEIHG